MLKNELEDLKVKDEQHFYGIYRGVVEDDNPSEAQKDGRIRVRVWGIHTPYKETDPIKGINVIPTDELPLAQPAYPVVIGSITGKGMWSVPVQGTHVFVFFENGDPMQPRYFATVPGIQPESMSFNSNLGFTDPDGSNGYPLSSYSNEPDMNRLMRGDGVKGTAWQDIESESVTTYCGTYDWEPGTHSVTYPNNFVIETRDLQTLEMNNNATLLYHNTDNYFVMKNSEILQKGLWKNNGGIEGTNISAHSTLYGCKYMAGTEVGVATTNVTISLLSNSTILPDGEIGQIKFLVGMATNVTVTLRLVNGSPSFIMGLGSLVSLIYTGPAGWAIG